MDREQLQVPSPGHYINGRTGGIRLSVSMGGPGVALCAEHSSRNLVFPSSRLCGFAQKPEKLKQARSRGFQYFRGFAVRRRGCAIKSLERADGHERSECEPDRAKRSKRFGASVSPIGRNNQRDSERV